MKEKYRELCQNEPTIPIFSRDWWLDTVAGEYNWDVVIVEKDGKIVASMPYYIKKIAGFTVLTHPALTQSLGPWLRETNAKYAKKLGHQKAFMEDLIDQLPDFDHYIHKWAYHLDNWLPFFWRNFKQTTFYTYVLPELGNEEKVWAGFQQNIRTDIRKASNRFNLQVRTDLNVNDFLVLHRKVFERQSKRTPYSEDLVQNLDKACVQRNARKIFIAEDDLGRRHAAVYLVWDKNAAYYLMGGSDPQLRNSGATSLCMWEAIKFASTVTMSFDFEGSMLEPVERFFRAFGAIQMPYFVVSKTPSKLLRIFFYFKELRLSK